MHYFGDKSQKLPSTELLDPLISGGRGFRIDIGPH